MSFYHCRVLIRPSPFILLPSPAIVETDILPKAWKSAICCFFYGASGFLPMAPWEGPRCDCFFCATLKISGKKQRAALTTVTALEASASSAVRDVQWEMLVMMYPSVTTTKMTGSQSKGYSYNRIKPIFLLHLSAVPWVYLHFPWIQEMCMGCLSHSAVLQGKCTFVAPTFCVKGD